MFATHNALDQYKSNNILQRKTYVICSLELWNRFIFNILSRLINTMLMHTQAEYRNCYTKMVVLMNYSHNVCVTCTNILCKTLRTLWIWLPCRCGEHMTPLGQPRRRTHDQVCKFTSWMSYNGLFICNNLIIKFAVKYQNTHVRPLIIWTVEHVIDFITTLHI